MAKLGHIRGDLAIKIGSKTGMAKGGISKPP